MLVFEYFLWYLLQYGVSCTIGSISQLFAIADYMYLLILCLLVPHICYQILMGLSVCTVLPLQVLWQTGIICVRWSCPSTYLQCSYLCPLTRYLCLPYVHA